MGGLRNRRKAFEITPRNVGVTRSVSRGQGLGGGNPTQASETSGLREGMKYRGSNQQSPPTVTASLDRKGVILLNDGGKNRQFVKPWRVI